MKHKVYLEYLVLSSQKGDGDALEKLIHHWQPRLLKHAWYLTGDGEVAKDMVQEAWIAAMKSFRNLQDPSRFRAWIYRIVTHKCADWVRRCQRQQKCYSEIPKTQQSEENDGQAMGTYLDSASVVGQHSIHGALRCNIYC